MICMMKEKLSGLVVVIDQYDKIMKPGFEKILISCRHIMEISQARRVQWIELFNNERQ